MGRTRWIMRWAWAVMGATAALAGGCAGNKADLDAVLRENQELRDRLAAEQQARQEAETRAASLEQENRDYAAHLERERNRGTASGDRFQNIPGVTESRRGAEVVVSIAGDVLFDSGQATLKPSAKRTLDRIASVIKSQYPGHTIRVEGYTDTDPIRKSPWKTNERLSGERAMAVQQYLISRGIPRERIYFAGFGDTRPRQTKQASRRVEIVILATAN